MTFAGAISGSEEGLELSDRVTLGTDIRAPFRGWQRAIELASLPLQSGIGYVAVRSAQYVTVTVIVGSR